MATRRARGTARLKTADLAFVLAAAGIAAVLWCTPQAPGWSEADLSQPLGSGWTATIVGALPVGDLWHRDQWIRAITAAAAGFGATWAAFGFFRGTGRAVAAGVSGPVATAALLLSASSPMALCFTATAGLATAWLLRSMVHTGHVAAGPRAQALGWAALSMTFAPHAGLLVLVWVATLSALRRRRRTIGLYRVPRGEWVAIACLVPTIGAGAVRVARPELPGMATAPSLAPWLDVFGPQLAWVAALLIALTIVPLRWRGGFTLCLSGLLATATSALWPDLFPAALTTWVLAVGVAGWIWLAGTVGSRPVRWVLVPAAAALVLVVAQRSPLGRVRPTDPLAAHRVPQSYLDLVLRGLLAPGDVLLTHDADLHRLLATHRAIEGVRPDLTIEYVGAPSPAIATHAMELAASGRRVLADSFDFGGQWEASWAVDSGPLFWFTGSRNDRSDQFLDLNQFYPSATLSRPTQARWARLIVERARFRRALGYPDQAVRELPVPGAELLSVRLRHGVSDSDVARGTELRGGRHAPPAAVAKAEAGDLLLAHGHDELGATLLAEAASDGWPACLGALARWQLRGGSVTAARAALTTLAERPELREEAVYTLDWLVRRDRLEDALWLRDHLPAAPTAAASESAARLALLHRLRPPQPAPVRDAPPLNP